MLRHAPSRYETDLAPLSVRGSTARFRQESPSPPDRPTEATNQRAGHGAPSDAGAALHERRESKRKKRARVAELQAFEDIVHQRKRQVEICPGHELVTATRG